MARANLNYSSELRNAFSAAQTGRTVRFIKVLIEGESVISSTIGNRQRDAAQDFDALLPPIVQNTSACMFLFCLSDGSTSSAPGSWLLVAWVPDTCKPRDKMLYSSSREDLKQTLGASLFAGEFYVNSASDFSFASYQSIGKHDTSPAPLREDEVLLRQIQSEEQAAFSGGRSKTMNLVPFHLTSSLNDKMQLFNSSRLHWVEMFVDTASESVETPASSNNSISPSTSATMLMNHVNETEGRFYALRHQGTRDHASSYFIYSCPEETPIREKMILSTAKSTVIAALANAGINFDKAFEVRCRQDLVDVLNESSDNDADR